MSVTFTTLADTTMSDDGLELVSLVSIAWCDIEAAHAELPELPDIYSGPWSYRYWGINIEPLPPDKAKCAIIYKRTDSIRDDVQPNAVVEAKAAKVPLFLCP